MMGVFSPADTSHSPQRHPLFGKCTCSPGHWHSWAAQGQLQTRQVRYRGGSYSPSAQNWGTQMG